MTHRHAHDQDGEPQKCVEIDPAVCLLEIDQHDGGALAGFIVGHDRPGFDVRCEGFVGVDGRHGNTWTMTGTLAGGDLTLSPSILCRLGALPTVAECGFHGYVRDGAWVPA